MKLLLNNKTMLFNVVFVLLGVAGALLNVLGYGEFQPDANLTALVVALVALVNAVSKYVTDKQ